LARPGVRSTFSQPGPSHPAAAVRLTRTLGVTLNPSRRILWQFLLAVPLSAAAAASAKCTLPAPDGSDERPTTPNVHGVIAEVKEQEVLVRQAKTGRLIAIQLPERPEIYTAFGGDAGIKELRSGQTAWVWFVGCRWPPVGKPLSAYFQIYSTDPNEKPR
jgi:hypothetical protein